MIHTLIYLLCLLVICGLAFWQGGLPERLGATIMLGGSLLSVPAASLIGSLWTSPEYGILSVDIIVFLLLVILSLLSDRFWPLWMTGIQLTSLIIHFAVMVEIAVLPRAYALAQGFWAYPMLLALLIGTHNVYRQKRMSEDSNT